MRKIFLLLIATLGFFSHLHGGPTPKKDKRYFLSVCALFKNESKNLREWIEYHRLVGVDHFYLYNNRSTDRYQSVLGPYIKEGIVTLTQWPDFLRAEEYSEENAFIWPLSTQIPAYENAILTKKHETEWIVFIDVDEFLIPVEESSLKSYLKKYKDSPGIILSREFYDASRIDLLPKRKLVIETVEMMGKPPQNIMRGIEKMIVKPELCKAFLWPPYKCIFQDDRQPVRLTSNEIKINQYVNRRKGYLAFGNIKHKANVDNRSLSEKEIADLLNSGYEIEDQRRPIYRFVPELLQKLGYSTPRER